MLFEQWIKKLWHHQPDDAQAKASLALALLIVHSDQEVALEEITQIDRLIEQSPFGDETEMAQFVASTRVQIEDALEQGAESITAFIATWAADLTTVEQRNQVIEVCTEMAGLDGTVNRDEFSVLGLVRSYLTR